VKQLLFLLGFLLVLSYSYATVDVLYKNNITKEYQYNDNDFYGIIGWQVVSGEGYDSIEQELIKSGYTKTDFPFKVDLIFSAFMLSIIFLIRHIIRNRK